MSQAKKFYIAWNRNSDVMFLRALLDAGFEGVGRPEKSDFILHDAIHAGLGAYLQNRPNFIYPHTPNSWFMWDGILGPDPTCCNFVCGEAGVKGMHLYGYPHRVEAIGFTRTEVRPFRPSQGKDLLIVPAHAQQHGEHVYPEYMSWVMQTLDFVFRNRPAFGKITLCWNEQRLPARLVEDMAQLEVTYAYANPFSDTDPLQQMIRRIESADLVMACNTTGCISVALGKPTVFFSERRRPRSTPREALHTELYWHLVRFPVQAEDLSIDELLAIRRAPNAEIENWKTQNIGGPFNADKFIRTVKEYL